MRIPQTSPTVTNSTLSLAEPLREGSSLFFEECSHRRGQLAELNCQVRGRLRRCSRWNHSSRESTRRRKVCSHEVSTESAAGQLLRQELGCRSSVLFIGGAEASACSSCAQVTHNIRIAPQPHLSLFLVCALSSMYLDSLHRRTNVPGTVNVDALQESPSSPNEPLTSLHEIGRAFHSIGPSVGLFDS